MTLFWEKGVGVRSNSLENQYLTSLDVDFWSLNSNVTQGESDEFSHIIVRDVTIMALFLRQPQIF